MPSFSTRTAALRSLKDISTDAVKNAKFLITEQDGKFHFDEDQAEQFLNTQDDITNANLENNMTTITLENLKTATTAELVTFYNNHAESSVKKFRDRATAEKKVQVILEALVAEAGSEHDDIPDGTDVEEMKVEAYVAAKTAPKMMSLSDTEAFAKSLVANKGKKAPKSIMGEMMKALVSDPAMTPPEVRGANPTTVITDEYAMPELCPSCGINLNNGVGNHLQEVNGKVIKHDKFEYCCLGCGEEFGPAIAAPAAKATSSARLVSDTQAETMKTTLKLDRTIVCGDQEWKNAFQMWKEHTDWMTSAQQDGLTAKLYKAAKNGQRITVEINGRFFHLKNV